MSIGIKTSAIQEYQAMERSLKKLSSGKRINSASDDAASFAVALTMEATQRSYGVASRNTQNAVGRLEVADSGLESQQESIARLRELAMQAGDGSLSNADRQAIQREADAVVAEIQRTSQSTSLNGDSLLSGDNTADYQVGTTSGSESRLSVSISGSTAANLGVSGLDLSTPAAASAALDTLDTANQRIGANRANIGATQNRLNSAYANTQQAYESTARSRSLLEDADVASEVSELAASQMRANAGVAMLAHSNAQRGTMLRLLG